MASAAPVKAEPAIKADPEDAMASPAPPSEDEYEDAGDLEFWDTSAPQDPAGTMYLTHVPKYLYEQWSQLADDDEIQIGTIRTWSEPDKKGQVKQRMAMLLDARNPAHQPVPKEYNLDVKDMHMINTFMFTEQHLPGYKSKVQGGYIPAHLRPKPEKPKDNKADGGRKRWTPYYRKAVPKKTTLAGRFRHELGCQPVMNAEAKHILAMRASDALKPKATTSMMAGARPVVNGLLHAGTIKGNDKFSGFTRVGVDPKTKAKKQKEEKAARMDQPILLDKIFKCFEDYKYWTMKSFKQQLNQPEAWLRENLDNVAVLNKTGRFANHWELKPEFYNPSAHVAVDAAAPDAGNEADESDEDEDGDVKMEDVRLA